jgi:hypothetical protein
MSVSIIGLIICIYIVVKTCKDAIEINNKLLELKTEIIKINSICETLELSKIRIIYNNSICETLELSKIIRIFDNHHNITNNHIYSSIIIILINIILIIICLKYNPSDNYNLLQILPFIMITNIINYNISNIIFR